MPNANIPILRELRRAGDAAGRILLGSTPVKAARPIQSEAISVARVLCILGIVYAHAWTGRTGAYVVAHSDSWQGIFRWLLVELVGRSSVPLLGMVSGWLVTSSALRRDYWGFILNKARTIAAPMIIWNILAVVLICGAVYVGWIRGPSPRGVQWLLTEIFSLLGFANINVQTPFLRDLFVCMILAPLLVRLKPGFLIALTLIVLVWTIGNWWFPLILRPQVLLFFLLGICARRWDVAEYVARMPFSYAALPFVILAPIKVALSVWGFWFGRENPELMIAIEVATRLSAAMLMWRTALLIAASPAKSFIQRFEPYMFLLFCSHLIPIWLFGLPVGRMFGPLDTPAYPLFLIIQPILALIAAIIIGRTLFAISPAMATLMSGGRLRVEREPNRVLATA